MATKLSKLDLTTRKSLESVFLFEIMLMYVYGLCFVAVFLKQ